MTESSSLSSIVNIEEIPIKTHHLISSTPTYPRKNQSESNTETSYSTVSDDYYKPSTILSDEDDNDTVIGEKGKNKNIKLVGKDYLLFKPKRPDSLYSKIMTTNEFEYIIDDLLVTFDNSYVNGMTVFLQFLVDLIGYQHVTINYTPRMNFELLLGKLVKNTTEIQSYFKCVINGTTSFAKYFSISVFNFLKDFIIAYNNCGRLSCMDILKDLLPFLNVMAGSQIRVIRLTVVTIAVKLCTTFLLIKKESERQINRTANTNNLKIFELIRTIQFLLEIHAENCCLNDPELFCLRVICCREIQDWVRLYPNTFITGNIIKLVRTLITDENKKVRRIASETAIVMLKTTNKLEQSDTNYIHFLNLSETISILCKDVYTEIRIFAMIYFTYCVTRFPDGISTDTRNYIAQRIYAKDINVAKQAGTFLYIYFIENDHPKNIFPFLIKLTRLNNFEQQVDLLVQTLIDIVPELKQFDEMLDFLMSENGEHSPIDNDDKIKFLEIFFHVSQMLLQNKYTIIREDTRKNINFAENNEQLVSALLPNLMDLFNIFKGSNESLLWILKALMLINFHIISRNKYRKVMLNMLNELKEILMENKNMETLVLVCQIFQKIYNEYSPFKGSAFAIFKNCYEMVYQTYVKSYGILKTSVNISSKDIGIISNNLFLLSIMSEYVDMSDTVEWTNIYLGWEVVEKKLEEISVYQIQCCRWYLVWELKYILQNTNNQGEEENLNQIVNLLNPKLLAYMDSLGELIKRSKSYIMKSTAFECMCNIILHIKEFQINELSDQVLLDNEYRSPVLLLEFALKFCFKNNPAPIEDKRKFLCKTFKLIFAEILPLTNLSTLFKHYLSFNKQYGEIFENILKQLREHSPMAIATVIMHTLVDSLGDFGITKTQEISQFLLSRNIIPKNVFQMMFQMGINFIINNTNKIALLTILQGQISKLTIEEKQKVLIFVEKNVPKKLLQHDTIIQFQKYLKSRIRGKWVRQSIPHEVSEVAEAMEVTSVSTA